MLIVVEGIDGSGKSTVADAIAAEMTCSRVDFPLRESASGVYIDQYLRGRWSTGQSDYARPGPYGALVESTMRDATVFQALAAVNKYEILPLLDAAAGNRTHVVLGRYVQSALVYGVIDGLEEDWIIDIHAGLPPPTLALLLDVDVATAINRQVARGGDPERYEARQGVTARARGLYRELWLSPPTAGYYASIDATQPIADVISDALWWVETVRTAPADEEGCDT